MGRVVAVLGADGITGEALTGNLVEAGFSVRAWNRSPETIRELGDRRNLGVHGGARGAARRSSRCSPMRTRCSTPWPAACCRHSTSPGACGYGRRPCRPTRGAMIECRPSLELATAAQDARLVAEAAARRELSLPLLEVVRERLDEAAAVHRGEDQAATFPVSAP